MDQTRIMPGTAPSPRMPTIGNAIEDLNGHVSVTEKLIERLQNIADKLSGSDRPPQTAGIKAQGGGQQPVMVAPLLSDLALRNDMLRARIDCCFSEVERIERAL